MYYFIGIFLVLIGWLYIKKPDIPWFFSIGWLFKNAEPSDLAIIINKLTGYAAVVIGVCYLIGGVTGTYESRVFKKDFIEVLEPQNISKLYDSSTKTKFEIEEDVEGFAKAIGTPHLMKENSPYVHGFNGIRVYRNDSKFYQIFRVSDTRFEVKPPKLNHIYYFESPELAKWLDENGKLQ